MSPDIASKFVFRTQENTKHPAQPLLQDVVRPLEAAGLLAATLSAGPRKWRGVALLPERTSAHADIDADGALGGAWQEVGDRMRDIRATRGKYVRLHLR